MHSRQSNVESRNADILGIVSVGDNDPSYNSALKSSIVKHLCPYPHCSEPLFKVPSGYGQTLSQAILDKLDDNSRSTRCNNRVAPFTQHQTMSSPLPVASAQGSLLKLANGSELIDAISSWWTSLFGHDSFSIVKKPFKNKPPP